MTGIKNCEQDYNRIRKVNNQKGVIHLALPLLLLLILGVGLFILVSLKVIKLPSFPGANLFQKKPSVTLKKDYKNPFNKDTQYVNPFDKYKNPFVAR